MTYLMMENLAILVCSTIGFLSGIRHLNAQNGLFPSMIVQGMICFVLARLYQCVLLWTGGSLTDGFQVGILGVLGAFSFFFSANFDQIDSLVDDGGKNLRKYRFLALIEPFYVILMLIPILKSPAGLAFKISCIFVAFAVSLACLFHTKHLIIPDVERGVVHCLRGFNALALALSVLSMWELIALSWGSDKWLIISGVGLCAVSLAIVPVMSRGVKKWKT